MLQIIYSKMKDLIQIILKFMIYETIYYPLCGKILEPGTCSPSIKMVVMSSLYPLRWILEITWYIGHSTLLKPELPVALFRG